MFTEHVEHFEHVYYILNLACNIHCVTYINAIPFNQKHCS